MGPEPEEEEAALEERDVGENEDGANASHGEEEEEEEDVQGSSSKKATVVLDKSSIECIPISDQAVELQSLELSMYEQDKLERGFMEQLEEQTGNLKNESERDRQIRMGEMTPFGTTLTRGNASSSTGAALTDFERYLMNQAELSKKQKRKKVIKPQRLDGDTSSESAGTHINELQKGSDKLAGSKGKSPLKMSVLHPKKRPKRIPTGTWTSENATDRRKPGKVPGELASIDLESGSEYVPSDESEDEDVKPKAKKLKRKHSVRKTDDDSDFWATDDSDWESSEDEAKPRRRKSKLQVDDGNMLDFRARVKGWNAESEYELLDGGLRVPMRLWAQMYKYQRVGVRWLWELHQQGCGGILGDEMGLGKTLQVISFLASLSCSGEPSEAGGVLVVCPATVMHQWVREFHHWWPPFRVAVLHGTGSFSGPRMVLIRSVAESRGVLVTSYAGLVRNGEQLLAQHWRYVVLDEGHRIRNPDSQATIMAKRFPTPHRILVSGSPLQNSLKELWSLMDFVFPGKLGTLPVFMQEFAVPITQGGYATASQVQVATAFRCASVLRDTINPYLLRRCKDDVRSHLTLPGKNEQVLFCRLTEEQRAVYKEYLQSPEVSRVLDGRLQVFIGLLVLRKICNHPDLFTGGPKHFGPIDEDLPESEKYGYWEKSGKMIVIEALLRMWHSQGQRVLLFAQGRQALCVLENFVKQQGYRYLRMDGATPVASRQPMITEFNSNATIFVFLLTTRVGGLGINLTGANRVVIFDPDWNPWTDAQARERAWRIGQTREVTVYRLLTSGTIEEKIFHRQIFKQFLALRVLKDPRQRRFFKANDLMELFTLQEGSGDGTETGAIFAGTGSEVRPKAKKRRSEQVKFSRAKLHAMKELAKRLSQQIAFKGRITETGGNNEENSKLSTVPSENDIVGSCTKPEVASCSSQNVSCSVSPVNDSERPETSSSSNNLGNIIELRGTESNRQGVSSSKCQTNPGCQPPSGHSKPDRKKYGTSSHRHHTPHKHSKHKRSTSGAKVDGESVPYLTHLEESKLEEDTQESSAKQDEYVLRKLFAKSGVHSAMKHDVLVSEGDPDYALVEGEADKVAKAAVLKLRESRRHCWRPGSGVPTWTGSSGAPKPTFGNKKKLNAVSSADIISMAHRRNWLTQSDDETNPTGLSSSDADLLDEIRSFVAFRGCVEGVATTSELLREFRTKVASDSTALFKHILHKLCLFKRDPESGLGTWRLRSEFRDLPNN